MYSPERLFLLLATLPFTCSFTDSFPCSCGHKLLLFGVFTIYMSWGMDVPSVAWTRKLATRNVFVERTLEPSFLHPFEDISSLKSVVDRVWGHCPAEAPYPLSSE